MLIKGNMMRNYNLACDMIEASITMMIGGISKKNARCGSWGKFILWEYGGSKGIKNKGENKMVVFR